MTAVTRGFGPDSLNARCSNEEGQGMFIAIVFILFLRIVAIPPPRPWWRGFSIYAYPGGVVW